MRTRTPNCDRWAKGPVLQPCVLGLGRGSETPPEPDHG